MFINYLVTFEYSITRKILEVIIENYIKRGIGLSERSATRI